MFRIVYVPVESVTAVKARPVASSLILTVAPGTAAPDPSTIVPVMLPYNTCAPAVVGNNPIMAASATTVPEWRNRRRHSRPNTLGSLTAILLGKQPEPWQTNPTSPFLPERTTTPITPC